MTYLPDIYQEFKQQFPEIAKAYDELASNAMAGVRWMKRQDDL